jgi:hypothetical protein
MERPSWAPEKEVIRNRSKMAVERKIIIDNPLVKLPFAPSLFNA